MREWADCDAREWKESSGLARGVQERIEAPHEATVVWWDVEVWVARDSGREEIYRLVTTFWPAPLNGLETGFSPPSLWAFFSAAVSGFGSTFVAAVMSVGLLDAEADDC